MPNSSLYSVQIIQNACMESTVRSNIGILFPPWSHYKFQEIAEFLPSLYILNSLVTNIGAVQKQRGAPPSPSPDNALSPLD